MENKSGYVYKIINLVNEKWYIGSHRTNETSIENCINDGYIGSGTLLLKAYEKYGIENFKKEILCLTENAYETEELILTELNAKSDKMSYNLKNTGTAPPINRMLGVDNPMYGKDFSDEHRFNLLLAKERNPSWNKGKFGKDSIHFGRKRNPETGQKISKALIGNRCSESIYKRVMCIETGEIFENISSAARSRDKDRAHLSKHLSGKEKSFDKSHWKLITDEHYDLLKRLCSILNIKLDNYSQ